MLKYLFYKLAKGITIPEKGPAKNEELPITLNAP
jgi:hypothetical protein